MSTKSGRTGHESEETLSQEKLENMRLSRRITAVIGGNPGKLIGSRDDRPQVRGWEENAVHYSTSTAYGLL